MLGSNDVIKARSFYDAVLPVIGGTLTAKYMPHAFCCELRRGGRVSLATPFDQDAAAHENGNMVGLACATAQDVDAANQTALSHGGVEEGDRVQDRFMGVTFTALTCVTSTATK